MNDSDKPGQSGSTRYAERGNCRKKFDVKKDTFDYSTCDYRDSFNRIIADPENRIGISDIAQVFAEPGPGWARGLLALRNRIVAVFGLKTTSTASDTAEEQHNGGARCGVFYVYSRSETGMLLGEDDKHLSFRVSLSLEVLPAADKQVTVTTFVKYNNRLGRVYFFFVKPFHRIIVPAVLKHKLRRLELEASVRS